MASTCTPWTSTPAGSFQTSFALAPAPREREVWSLFEGNWGGKSRIRRGLYLNLGAVGDRADPRGRAWLGLPRPAMPDRYPSLPVTLGPNAAWYYHPVNTEITGTDCPWLYSSGVRDPGTIAIQTAATADVAESAWTVRLHFAELEAAAPGARVFDIKLQGETVLRDFDIARTAGTPRAAIAREFEVRAGPVLQVELVPHPAVGTRALPPILSAIEIERVDTR